MHPDVLDIEATASLLSLSKTSTYRVVRSGEIPAWRVGKQWRLWRPAVLLAVGGPEVERDHPMYPKGDPELIDRFALAELIDLAPATCLLLLRNGTIPSRRVGASTRIWWPNVRQLMIDGAQSDPVAEAAGH